MRIRLRRTWAGPGLPPVFAGDVVVVPEAVGRRMLADGTGTLAVSSPIETATVGPSARAAHTQRPAPRTRSG